MTHTGGQPEKRPARPFRRGGTILHRYLAKEFLAPSLIGLVLFTSVFLSQKILRLLDLLLTQGIEFRTIARLYVLSLPSFLPLTIPLSFLVGLTVGFSRISADGEYMAMRVTGRSFRSLLLAPAVFAVLFYSITLYISFYAQPQAATAFKELLRETAESQIQGAIKERVFFDDFENLLLYVQKVSRDRKTFQGVFIADQRSGREVSVMAGTGALSTPTREAAVGEEESRKFILGRGVSITRDREKDELSILRFDRYEIPLRYVKKTFVRPLPDPRDLTHARLTAEISRMKAEGVPHRSLFPYQIEYHRKWAQPFSCLVFLIIGPALVAVARGAGTLRGYWICLSLAFIYYLIMAAATRMGERGLIHPLAVAWSPNILLLLVGWGFYRHKEYQGA